jgi:TolA-binding protein
MRKVIYLLATLSLSLLVGCASHSVAKKTQQTPIVKTQKVLDMEKKAREHEEALQDLRDRNLVLNKKAQMDNSSAVKLQARPQNKKIEMISASGKNWKSDRELYAELVGSYDRNNEIAFFSRFQAFQEKYSKSPLADDATYLAGLMSLSNKNYGPALRYFNQLLKQHPNSHKAAAAWFAKGATLKKMNLNEESRYAFSKVRQSYPGSPEALRAETELKLLTR